MTPQPWAEQSLRIREVTERDLSAVREIYARHVLHGLASFEEVPPSIDELRARWLAVRDAGLPYLAADVDGRLNGYAYAFAYRTRPAYRYTVEDSIYVAPGFMGRGVGSALLRALIERCEPGPWRQMLAIIGDSGNGASIALHRRHGFELVGTLRSVGFKLGRWVDTVLMQRTLGVGDQRPPQGAQVALKGGPAILP